MIRFIDKNSFENLIDLKELHLHNNRLNQIESETINSLLNLNGLFIEFNEISTFSFRIKSLVKLKLIYNRLKTLSFGQLNTLVNLKELHLQHNQLTRLEGKWFEGLEKLTIFYVYSNKIKTINDFYQ